jgi:hypothetical protein
LQVDAAAGLAREAGTPAEGCGEYRLEEEIGPGGMAVVFRARDERLGRSRPSRPA